MKLSLRRVLTLFAALLFALATGMTAANAATDFTNAPSGAHYANGFSEPVCTVDGVTVTCTNTKIGGVGNTNATVVLTVSQKITGVCHNPGNYNVVDPFTKTVTTSTEPLEIKPGRNGQLVVPTRTLSGTSSADFRATFSCPNPRWTAEVTSNVLTYTYTLTFDGFTDPAILITGQVTL